MSNVWSRATDDAVKGLPFPGFPTVVDRYGRAAWAGDQPGLTPHHKHIKKAQIIPCPMFETCTTLKALDCASYPIGFCTLQPGIFKMYE
jgi:hypothetical protein